MSKVWTVDDISIDAAQGKIQISGTIDPHKVLKLLDKDGKKSELLWEPVMDQMESHVVPTPQSSRHGISYGCSSIHDDKDLVVHLQKMSEIKGLRCVEVSEEGMKLTFREYDGKNDSCFARNSNGTAMHMHMTYPSADHCPSSHGTCCSRNKAMYDTHAPHCDGSQGQNAQMDGIPWPGYIKPSAPPMVQMPQFYSPAPPSYEYGIASPYNNHPVFTAFSDENPNSCIIM